MRLIPTFWLFMQFLTLCIACPKLQAGQSEPQTAIFARYGNPPPVEPAQNGAVLSKPALPQAQPRFNRLMYRVGLFVFMLAAPLSIVNFASFLSRYSIVRGRRIRQPLPIMNFISLLLLLFFVLSIFYAIRLLDDSVLITGTDKQVGWTRAKTRLLLAALVLSLLLLFGIWSLIAGAQILAIYLNFLSFGLLLWLSATDAIRHFPASDTL